MCYLYSIGIIIIIIIIIAIIEAGCGAKPLGILGFFPGRLLSCGGLV